MIWAADTDTNTNIANTNLNLDASRTLGLGANQNLTFTGSGTSKVTFSNLGGVAKAGATYILKITQPSGGNGTINWDNIGAANIKWPGGTEPTLTATNAAIDIVTLICTSATGQGVYYANATLNFS